MLLLTTLLTILLDSATATTGTIAEFLDKFDMNTVEEIWGTRIVNGQKVDGWYSVLIPVATSLGALFSLFVAARIAYKSMVLEDGINVLDLLRPILISFILTFWWPITWSLYQLTQPLEDYFRECYEYQNTQVEQLKKKRMQLAQGVHVKIAETAAEQELVQKLTDQYIDDNRQNTSETQVAAGGADASAGSAEDLKFKSSQAYFSDILYEDDIKGEVLVRQAGDTIRFTNVVEMAETAWTVSKVESGLLWVAEALWTIGIFFIFLIRNLMLTVLVMFGPVYLMCSLVHVWKDKWTEWLSRFIAVSLYGPLTYIALYFTLFLIEFAIEGDIMRMEAALNSGADLLSYIVYIGTGAIPTVGYYFITMIIGTACIPLSVELSSFFIPGDVGRGATKFYAGMEQHFNEAVQKTAEQGKKAVVAVVTAGTGAAAESMAEHSVEKAAKELASDTAMHTAMEAGVADTFDMGSDLTAESFADRFWRDKLDELTGTEEDLDTTAEEIDAYIKAVEEGKDADFLMRLRERIDDNARLLAIFRLGYVPDGLFKSETERDAFLSKHKLDGWFKAAQDAQQSAEDETAAQGDEELIAAHWEAAHTANQQMADTAGAILAERKLHDMVEQTDWRKAAERAADRTFADELKGGKGNTAERIKAADEDLEAYTRAVQAGYGDEYIRIKEQRMDENRKLSEHAQGVSAVQLFGIFEKERNAFLKQFGLLKAFRRAEKLQRKADNLRPDGLMYRRMHPIYEQKADEIRRMIAEYSRDILYARGITSVPEGRAYGQPLQDKYSSINGGRIPWFDRLYKRGEEVRRCITDSDYFFRKLVDGGHNTLMRIPWFRLLVCKDAGFSTLLDDSKIYRAFIKDEARKMTLFEQLAVYRKLSADKSRKQQADQFLDLMFEVYEVEDDQHGGCRTQQDLGRKLWQKAKQDPAGFQAAYASLLAMRRKYRS